MSNTHQERSAEVLALVQEIADETDVFIKSWAPTDPEQHPQFLRDLQSLTQAWMMAGALTATDELVRLTARNSNCDPPS